MPPRYAYWTILIGDEPTSFRSGAEDELLPTLKRLQVRQPNARMVWFQNGKIWNSRIDAQEAMDARGEMGRRGDVRQRDSMTKRRSFERNDRRESKGERGGFRQREDRDSSGKLEWKPKDQKFAAESRESRRSPKGEGGLEWKPKGEGDARGERRDRPERPAWKPTSESRPEWTPKRRTDFAPRSDWKPQGERRPEWKPKGDTRSGLKPKGDRRPEAKLEWEPKGTRTPGSRPGLSEKRGDRDARRVEGIPDPGSRRGSPGGPKSRAPRGPKNEGRTEWKAKPFGSKPKSAWKPKGDRRPEGKLEWEPKGTRTPGSRLPAPGSRRESAPKPQARDKNWRPGGDHKDPRQKYKDAKKAKWGRFKANIRARWEGKQSKGKKKKDEE